MRVERTHLESGLEVLVASLSPEPPKLALIMLHGRGATAEGMLELYRELKLSDATAYAPQAPTRTWYPHSFMAAIESNEPFLTNSLGQVAELMETLNRDGITPNRIAFLGFSQGACLASEFVARNPGSYAGLVALSGGLIGPTDSSLEHPGSLTGTKILLASSDPDPHVPFFRVSESASTFEKMGASVELRRFPGMGHTINEEEIELARKLLSSGE